MNFIQFIKKFSTGCRSSSINLEARSLTGWSTNRHCVVARLQDITSHHLREIRSKAGALFIVLPKDMTASPELQQVSNTLNKFLRKHDKVDLTTSHMIIDCWIWFSANDRN